MRTGMATVTLAWLVGTWALAQQPDAADTTVRFTGIDVVVNVGNDRLAAYQVELRVQAGEVAFVGVEGGEHPAYAEPPYYDPRALTKDRLIIAAFTTGNDVPTGSTRVARIHVRVTGAIEPEYDVRLTVAADSTGAPIEAEAVLRPGVGQ